jgi:acetate---CoA ligase (ADP-forming)
MTERLGLDVSVDEMVGDGVETSVGFVRDPTFGPLIVVAAGGVLVELLADRVVACPPLSADSTLALLDALRIRPLFEGWRGSPAAHLNGLVNAIVGFSAMTAELGDVLDAVEANPVIVSADGVVAVDILVVRQRDYPRSA